MAHPCRVCHLPAGWHMSESETCLSRTTGGVRSFWHRASGCPCGVLEGQIRNVTDRQTGLVGIEYAPKATTYR